MIVLDTNALSELMRPAPSEEVVHWLRSQERLNVFVTAITRAELLYGIEVLPEGRRKQGFSEVARRLFEEHFRDRILPFDQESAKEFAGISASRRAAGRPIAKLDAMIAAIARCHSATLATRNSPDFEGCGIRVINPWLADVH